MNAPHPLFDEVSLRDLLRWIASTRHGSPGAGSAAAIAIGLGVSCLLKAAAVTARQHELSPQMRAAVASAEQLQTDALRAAAGDAAAFARFINRHDAASIDGLLRAEDDAGALGARLLALLDMAGPHVAASMRGDLLAAKVLCQAALQIVDANRRETLESSR